MSDTAIVILCLTPIWLPAIGLALYAATEFYDAKPWRRRNCLILFRGRNSGCVLKR